MRFAKVENGVVKGVFEAQQEFADSQGWIACDKGVDAGWLYDGSDFSEYAPPPPTFEELQVQKLADIAAKKDELRDGGFEYGGAFIHTDTQARSLLLGEKMAGSGDVKFFSRNGYLIEMTRLEFDDFYDAFHARIKAVEENGLVLAKAANDATTIEDLDAIDIESGWPS